MGSDSTNFHAGCHGPVPLESVIYFEDAATHSTIWPVRHIACVITEDWFVRFAAAIRSAHGEGPVSRFWGRANRRPLDYECETATAGNPLISWERHITATS